MNYKAPQRIKPYSVSNMLPDLTGKINTYCMYHLYLWFQTNPCKHPIIFMRDVEAQHIVALMEFMYAGEVNVAQAQLSAFLKTAESLKIRGLTDTSSCLEPLKDDEVKTKQD